tara:strand:- start:290 stop:493 length:204 start_codon:yes stop_codon:yes gene_type:complete
MNSPTDDNELVDRVIIDLCAKSFKLLGNGCDENLIQCETTDEFMGVLKVCKEYIVPSRIEYADLSLK